MERLTSVVHSSAPSYAKSTAPSVAAQAAAVPSAAGPSAAGPSATPTADSSPGQNWKTSPIADKKRGPKESLATQNRVRFHKPPDKADKKKEQKEAELGQDKTALDYDIALAAFHAGDLESAGAMVEKLKRMGQEKPGVFQLAVVQLSLAVQEGRIGARKQKSTRPPQVFQRQPAPPKHVIDLSV